MKLFSWFKREVPIPKWEPKLTELEAWILEDFTKHPEKWSVRDFGGDPKRSPKVIRADTRGLNFLAQTTGVTCGAFEFSRDFSLLFYQKAEARLIAEVTKLVQKQAKVIENQLIEVFGQK